MVLCVRSAISGLNELLQLMALSWVSPGAGMDDFRQSLHPARKPSSPSGGTGVLYGLTRTLYVTAFRTVPRAAGSLRGGTGKGRIGILVVGKSVALVGRWPIPFEGNGGPPTECVHGGIHGGLDW
jgi:hypothetical protein